MSKLNRRTLQLTEEDSAVLVQNLADMLISSDYIGTNKGVQTYVDTRGRKCLVFNCYEDNHPGIDRLIQHLEQSGIEHSIEYYNGIQFRGEYAERLRISTIISIHRPYISDIRLA